MPQTGLVISARQAPTNVGAVCEAAVPFDTPELPGGPARHVLFARRGARKLLAGRTARTSNGHVYLG